MAEPSLPIGETLASVRYELLTWESRPRLDSLVDEVAMAVILVWQTAPSTRITWSTNPWREGLVQGEPGEGGPSPEVEVTDVSERWPNLIGERLAEYMFAYQEPSPDLPWAVHLGFSSGRHLIIALGELLDDRASYIPDSLLVTASRDVAEAYRPTAAAGTAWSDRGD